jgi:hypothetical protein
MGRIFPTLRLSCAKMRSRPITTGRDGTLSGHDQSLLDINFESGAIDRSRAKGTAMWHGPEPFATAVRNCSSRNSRFNQVGSCRTRVERVRSAGLARRESDSVLFTARAVSPLDQLWTTRALPVDGLRPALRGFRKSHHLIRAGHRRHAIRKHGSFGRLVSAACPHRPSYACAYQHKRNS